jgi:hypothetical protein
MIYSRFKDPNIIWDSRLPLITNMSDSDCINDLRFHKIHLETVAQKLWPLMQPHLEGDYDHIHLQNHYMLPFEMCFMLLLYHLAASHCIQPDMECFFRIRKSKISATLNTFVDAFLYEAAILIKPCALSTSFSFVFQIHF